MNANKRKWGKKFYLYKTLQNFVGWALPTTVLNSTIPVVGAHPTIENIIRFYLRSFAFICVLFFFRTF